MMSSAGQTDKSDRPLDAASGDSRQVPQHDETAPRWLVSQLVGSGREAILEHEGQDYRLRLTAKNRLILTK